MSAYVTCLALDRDRSLAFLLLSFISLFLTGQTEARVLCFPSQLIHFGVVSVQLLWVCPVLAQKAQIDCLFHKIEFYGHNYSNCSRELI